MNETLDLNAIALGAYSLLNAKCETVPDLPTFRDAYRLRRCIVPVDGFLEWKAIKGQKARQPYAIAMKDGAPFGIAGLWENWKEPATGEWIRTFAVVTTEANEMVAEIHDRMPVILAPSDYACWLSDEPDPCDLMCPFPAGWGLGSGRLTNAPRPAPRAASPSLKSPWPAVRRLWPCRQRDPRSRLPTSLDSIPDTIGTLR